MRVHARARVAKRYTNTCEPCILALNQRRVHARARLRVRTVCACVHALMCVRWRHLECARERLSVGECLCLIQAGGRPYTRVTLEYRLARLYTYRLYTLYSTDSPGFTRGSDAGRGRLYARRLYTRR